MFFLVIYVIFIVVMTIWRMGFHMGMPYGDENWHNCSMRVQGIITLHQKMFQITLVGVYRIWITLNFADTAINYYEYQFKFINHWIQIHQSLFILYCIPMQFRSFFFTHQIIKIWFYFWMIIWISCQMTSQSWGINGWSSHESSKIRGRPGDGMARDPNFRQAELCDLEMSLWIDNNIPGPMKFLW